MNLNLIFKIMLFVGFKTIMLNGQTVELKFIDENKLERIPFVNIYFPATKTGQISDMDGTASVDLSDKSQDEQVVFSSLSYFDLHLSVKELLSCSGSVHEIKLKPSPFILDAATVVDKKIKFKEKKIGEYKGANGYFDLTRMSVPGSEIGVILKIKDRYKIKEIRTKIKDVEVDSFLVEFNIYNYFNNEIGELLQRRRIFQTITKDDSDKEIVVDVSEQNIWIESNIFIAMKILWLTTENKESIFISAKTKDKIAFERYPLGEWEDAYIYPMIYTVMLKKKE